MTGDRDPKLEAMAEALEASGDYRVLRRFRPGPGGALGDSPSSAVGMILDFETTGLDPAADRIIQIALVPFRFSRETGEILAVAEPVVYFEDPGGPLPAEIVRLTGITDDDVRGQRIDEAVVAAVAGGAALIVAHNASFDRPFAERRMPLFRDRHWACSQREVPWKLRGLGSAGLEFLLMKHCGLFHSGHRADHDCQALLHLLGTPFESGETPFQLLLASARQKSYRIWAIGSPYDRKDELKRRGYRFNNGDDGRPKSWYRDISAAEQPEESAWLAAAMYGGDAGRIRVDTLDSRTRYSDRTD